MSGTTVKDLQQAGLYSKLKPYLENIKNVDAAIERARANGEWTAADDKKLSLNGNKAWGEFDAFQREQKEDLNYAFKEGFSKANEKAVARDAQKHPSKYEPKKYELPDGSYVVYQKSTKNGKETATYYNRLGQQISEAAFKRATRITELKVNPETGKLLATCENQREDKIPNVLELVGIGAARVLGIMGACEGDKYDYSPTYETNINVGVTVINENSTVEELMSAMNETLKLIAQLQSQSNANTAEIKAQIEELNQTLKKYEAYLVTIVTNQEKNAATAEQYYKMIINAIGANNDLLNIVIDKLVEGNTTLSSVKKLMEQNNADNKEILEAVTKIKYGVDELGLDVKEIKKLMTQISSALTNLPKALRAEFEPYFKQIVSGIADGNVKLADLTKLLQQVNQNIVIGNDQQKEATKQVLELLTAMNLNITTGMTDILNAIKSGNKDIMAVLDKILAKLGNIDVNTGNANKNLAELVKLVGAISAKMSSFDPAKLMAKLDEILKAIKDHEVKVTVDGTIKVIICDDKGNTIHEGELDPNDPDGFHWIS